MMKHFGQGMNGTDGVGTERAGETPAPRESPVEPAPNALIDLKRERDILAEAQNLANIGAWEWEVDSGALWLSDEVYRIFGREPREFAATYQTFTEHVHPDDRSGLWGDVEAALAGSGEHDFRYRALRPDGSVRHVHERGRVTRDERGRPVTMLGTILDATDEVLLQRERDDAVASLAESEERYRLLAENAWDVIWTMELDGTISYVSPSVERMRGLTPAEAMAQAPEDIQPPESVAIGAEYYTRLFTAMAAGTELPSFHGEQEYYRKDGSIMHGELDVIPQVDGDGNAVRILGVTRDISERKRLESELSRLAQTDPLTGVWNRRHTEELLDTAIQDARREGYPLAALMLDIDHFKETNDDHGHRAGDEVLIELTRRIDRLLDESNLLGRWGGEEFVIMIDPCTLDEAIPTAQSLRRAICDNPFEGVGSIAVSIGIAELQADDDLASWIHRADEAMYAAKAAGRNTVRADG